MGAPPRRAALAAGLAALLGGCNPAAWPDCYRTPCAYPPTAGASYAGYVPAGVPGRPAFGAPPFDDPFAEYTRRSVTISPGAGNAQAANLALQTATPWPANSGDTRIPGNGAQMVRAVQQLETGTRPPLAAGAGPTAAGAGAPGGGPPAAGGQ